MKRKILLFLMLLTLGAAGALKAQTRYSGSGTSADPYLIQNETDWNTFATNVTDGTTTYSGKYFQLTNDITVSTTAGIPWSTDKGFWGTFDGQNHTITLDFNYINEDWTAPFRYIYGATIKNVKVSGYINTSLTKAASLVGLAQSSCTITNCYSDVDIYSTADATDGTNSGLVAASRNSITISGCVFAGKLRGVSNSSVGNNGGFVGYWYNAGSVNISDCVFAPSEFSLASSSSWTFVRSDGSPTVQRCYYTQSLGHDQGTRAYKVTLAASPAAGGTVDGGTPTTNYGFVKAYSNGVYCGCNGVYYATGNVSLSATANEGYTFIQWSDNNTSNPRTVNVSGDASYTAVFSGGSGDCDYSEDFEGTSATDSHSSEGPLPSGWSYIYTGSAGTRPHVCNATSYPGTVSSGNYLVFNAGTTSGYATDSYAIMPSAVIPTGQGASHISFKARFESSSNGTLTYGTISGTDASTYSLLGTVSRSDTNPVTVDVDLDPSLSVGKRLAFHWYMGSSWYTCGVDDICVTTESSYTITVNTNTGTYGSVSGGGTFWTGETAHITATANANGYFYKWSDGNTNASRDITVTGDATYTAIFVPKNISSTTDWNNFVAAVNGTGNYNNNACDYSSKTVTMTASVGTVTTMAGTSSNRFKGTFDGQGHTLTVNISTTERYAAPFHYVENATIKNLVVEGNVLPTSSGDDKYHAAGLVGSLNNAVTVINCWVKANVGNSDYRTNYCGGIIGHMGSLTVSIQGTAYTGTLYATGTNYVGGLIGWGDTPAGVTLTDCYFGGTYNNTSSGNFHPVGVANSASSINSNNISISNCYYSYTISNSGTVMADDNTKSIVYNATNKGKFAYSITPGTGVSVANAGTETTYGGSTATDHYVIGYGTGIKHNDVLYAGEGDNVSLTLGGSTITGEYEADHGTLAQSGSNWTLTMEANNTVISAVNCFRPTNLAANGNTITWSGNDASYIVEYGVATTTTVTNQEILNEGFDNNGTVLPSGWESVSGIGSGSFVISDSEGSHSGSYSAGCAHSNRLDETYLITPMMDLSNATSATLTFWMKNRNWGTSDIEECHVYYRVNEGPWSSNSLFSTTTENSDWTQKTVTITSDFAANYQLGFKCVDHYGHGLCIDDVVVTWSGTVPTTEWHEASAAVTSPYTFTDSSLTPGATYPARVKSECGQVSNVVEFTMPNTFEVTVSANPSNGGTIDHTGGTWSGSTGTYQYGANAELTANPATGYTFTGWTIDDESVGATNPITVTMDADHTVVANFGLIGYTITTSVNPENSGSVTGGGEYHYGDQCTLTAIPAEGYSFSKWNDNTTINPRTFTVMGSGAYTAIFTPNNYTIGYENDGNGTCTGPANAIYGSTVEVTVNPATGYELATLTYNDGSSDHTITPVSGVYSFTMPAHSVTVSATFSKINYAITYTYGDHGTCTGPATANYGDNVTVTVTPDEGYALASLTYNGTPITPVGGVYAFTMPASAVTVHATFVAYVSVTYAVSPTGAGTVTYSPEGEDYDGGTASQEVSIGSGSGTQNVFPINGNSINSDPAYSVCEMLYKKGEIGMSGTIKKLSFFYNGATTLYGREIDLYLKQTDRENFKGIGWEKIVASDYCPSTVTVSATETSGVSQVTITLSGDGFEYDGTLNLLVAIYDHTGSTGPVNWYYTSTGTDNDSKTCTVFTSTEGIIPTALTQAQQGAASPNRPNIKIEIAAEGGNTVWYTSGATPTFTATPTLNSGYYFLNWTDGETVVWDNPYTLDPITSNRNLTANFVNYKRFTTAGDWNTASNWTPAGVPDEYIDVRIEANATISGLAKAKDIVGFADGCGITIEDGGQLWHSNDVAVTITKHVEGYEDSHSNEDYILFSMPFSGVSNNSLVTTDSHYDWYYFSYNNMEGGELLEWVHETATTVPFMRGYIYANEADKDITVSGVATQNDSVYIPATPLAYSTSGSYRFNGWNLVGNPFVCNAYAFDANGTTGGELNFFKLNAAGDEFEAASSSDAIAPMGALMVKATATGEKVRYSRTAPPSKSGILNMSVTKTNYRGTIDLARIRFGEGEGLPKFQLNPDHTKLYVPMEDADYAVVYAEPVGEMPVSFKAEENGQYTLTFSGEEVDFSYLHLIDNLTGADVDLLETPYYTFSARTTDYASRFKVVFATGSGANDEPFAFYSNGTWVIANDGDAILQVVDVTGRVLSSDRISGATSKPIHAAPGVYMLRLINGDNVRVQKVVVK